MFMKKNFVNTKSVKRSAGQNEEHNKAVIISQNITNAFFNGIPVTIWRFNGLLQMEENSFSNSSNNYIYLSSSIKNKTTISKWYRNHQNSEKSLTVTRNCILVGLDTNEPRPRRQQSRSSMHFNRNKTLIKCCNKNHKVIIQLFLEADGYDNKSYTVMFAPIALNMIMNQLKI